MDVDQYITLSPEETQDALRKIRAVIKEVAPEAKETFAYRMPACKLNGKPLVYFAAFKNHIGFYPTARGIEAFGPELSKYKHSKGAIQFPLGKPMPVDLIKRIVKNNVDQITKS